MLSSVTAKLLAAIFFAANVVALPVQTVPAEFEVASVHMVQNHGVEDLKRGIGVAYVSPYGTSRFIARNVSLDLLIFIAYGVEYNQISGEPKWMETQLYDVAGEVDSAIQLTREQTQPLLKHLLESRFHLKTHTEDVQLSGYALVAAKGTPKLKPSSQTETYGQILPNGLQAKGITLKVLAAMLQRPAGKPVVDQTGISGTFDFTLRYAPEDGTDSALPSLFTALEEQLGLKLQPQKIPMQKLVIDQVERTPLDN